MLDRKVSLLFTVFSKALCDALRTWHTHCKTKGVNATWGSIRQTLLLKGLKVSLSSSVEEIVHWEGQEA